MEHATPLSPILYAKVLGGSGGGNPNAVLYTAQTLSDAQQEQARTNIRASKAETTVTVSGTTPTITPEANTIYDCGELASLTITAPPASGSYSIVFTSGSTPTEIFIPPKPAMKWQTDDNEPPQGFPAANTRYEINVRNTYVTMGEWPVPEVSA